MEAGREFQFLEVIGTNVLAKEVVRGGPNKVSIFWKTKEHIKFLKFNNYNIN